MGLWTVQFSYTFEAEMAHPLLRRPTHGNSSAQNSQAQQALNQNKFEAAIFVGRRKVWAGRGATRDEAFGKAKAEETKYNGANPEIKVKQVKAGS